MARKHPEWGGYLAAFQSYVDARQRGDRECARQARLLMEYFADGLLSLPAVPRHEDLAELLELLEIPDE